MSKTGMSAGELIEAARRLADANPVSKEHRAVFADLADELEKATTLIGQSIAWQHQLLRAQYEADAKLDKISKLIGVDK